MAKSDAQVKHIREKSLKPTQMQRGGRLGNEFTNQIECCYAYSTVMLYNYRSATKGSLISPKTIYLFPLFFNEFVNTFGQEVMKIIFVKFV